MYPRLALVAGIGSRNRSIGKAGGLLRMVPDDFYVRRGSTTE